MNRRDFLRSLAALSGAMTLPFELPASTSKEAVEHAWKRLQEHPVTFYVREYGTITTDPTYDVFPSSRAEFYDIAAPSTLADVAELADRNHLARGILEGALQDAGVGKLAGLDEEGADEVISQLADWVNGTPEPWDEEGLRFYAQLGQTYALSFFRDEFEYCDDLNISIIEGECPGSSYFAAELIGSVEDANEIAEGLGIPIRFAWLGL